VLKQARILSLKEKKAKEVKFDEHVNIVLGDNDTGKSSLLKSIMYAFGAEPHFHPQWESISPIVMVDFNLDGRLYTILRNKTQIAVFDSDRNVLNLSESITKEAGHLSGTRSKIWGNLADGSKTLLNSTQV